MYDFIVDYFKVTDCNLDGAEYECQRRQQLQNTLLNTAYKQGRIIQGAKGGYSPGAPQDRGHHKIGGTTLADFKMDILVAFFIFLKGTYICDPVIS